MTKLLARLCDALGAYRLADRFRPIRMEVRL